jgi:hypothetical protein
MSAPCLASKFSVSPELPHSAHIKGVTSNSHVS